MTTRQKVSRGVGLGLAGAGLMALGVMAGGAWADAAPVVRTTYGEPVAMGDGTASVYLRTIAGAPVELGVALSEHALEGLPTHHTPGGVELEPGHFMFFSTPEMPGDNPTPFEHVFLGWNPGGHEPPGVYDVPHFDFHFYTISNEARLAIDGADPAFMQKATHHPAPQLMPAGYVAIPGGVPMMGAHWVDPTTPELNGQPFTETFLYGSWDGEAIFAEPMITKAYLETRPQLYERLPIPEARTEAGWQPGAYRVYYDEATREYRVALTDFVWREATR